ncbi:DNA-binding transcription factor [Maudiozyma humilis]|uniref:DNA-binding transcription factor n=1 Tax=Maudiozyma humilis TaxID=51915 RepID=A0AAV5S2X5_MAUHU|nr:DNA-binding transcription factor [Kazachstania humilis]
MPTPTPTPTPNTAASNFRVAQACDRCRSKKTRCDGRRPQCSQCAAVGFECKVSDKLIRKSFPRGYTESLEERVRELEAENRRLLALNELKEQQIDIVTGQPETKSAGTGAAATNATPAAPLNVSQTNLLLLSQQGAAPGAAPDEHAGGADHVCSSACGGDANPNAADPASSRGAGNPGATNAKHGAASPRSDTGDNLHAKPVATTHASLRHGVSGAGDDDPTAISFEQAEAPGLAAARALRSIRNHESSTQLATLVSLSIPRSTEEILFIPQLMAKIRQTFGFTSKHSLYTVTLLSSLKSALPRPSYPAVAKIAAKRGNPAAGGGGGASPPPELAAEAQNMKIVRDTSLWEIDDVPHFFREVLRLDIVPRSAAGTASATGNASSNSHPLNFYLKFHMIDELIALYFAHWSKVIPVLNKQEFFMYYAEFKEGIARMHDTPLVFPQDQVRAFNYKFFATLLVVICQMGILIKMKNNNNKGSNLHNLCAYYHRLVYTLPANPYFTYSTTCVKTLQLLCLVLYYHLNTGDILEIYGLRGKVVSMSQQLRLHRCPSAVLVGSGSTMNRFEQSNRRVLFWMIYYLDVFSSLQLGVPRLMKDHEIECALPVGMDEDGGESSTANGESSDDAATAAKTPLKLEGAVSLFSLAVIRYAKVMGNILDVIFKRNMSESITKQIALIHENALDNWRYRLPAKYQFKLDVTGSVDMDSVKRDSKGNNDENSLIVILYFLAKSIIHLPVLASKPLVIDATQSTNGTEKLDRSSSSFVSLQQAINTMLAAFYSVKDDYLALPIDSSRTLARFSILSAQGSLDYIKGGSLYIDNKKLLLDIIQSIENDRKIDLPGVISYHSLKLLDLTVNLYLQGTGVKPEKLEKFLQKKLNYYNKLMGKPSVKSLAAVQKEQQPKKATVKSQVPSASGKDNATALKKVDSGIKQEDEHLAAFPNGLKPKTEAPSLFQNHKNNANATLAPPLTSLNPAETTASTQTAFAEALQLDPVLNSNAIPSNFDLAKFFSNTNNMNIAPSQINGGDADKKNDLADSNAQFKGLTKSMNNSTTFIDRMFNTSNMNLSGQGQSMPDGSGIDPAQAQLISNMTAAGNAGGEGATTGLDSKQMSSNNLSAMLMFLNNDFSLSSSNVNGAFNNALQMNSEGMSNDQSSNMYASDPTRIQGDYPSFDGPQTNSYNANYDFIVDGSLGLAPLLADDNNSPAFTQGRMTNRDSTVQNQQRRFTTEDINNTIGNNVISNNENELSFNAPRRFTYNGEDSMSPQGQHRPVKRRKRNNDAANDLFEWQNST